MKIFDIAITIGIAAIAYFSFKYFVGIGVQEAVRRRKNEIEDHVHHQRRMVDEHRTTLMAELNEKQFAVEKLARNLDAKQHLFDSMYAAFNRDFISGRKWLADFLAETYEAPDIAKAWELIAKTPPARKAADELRVIAKEKKELLRQNKLLEYTLRTYHEYFPTLEQYSEDVLNERATLTFEDDGDESADVVSIYISTEEYNALNVTQRNQLALDNWKRRPKSSVEIGRMYERYIGYLYEEAGWSVEYFGATQGLEDLGRDLICSTETDIHIVQAKYWSQHRTIHEKHIFQLYGTTVVYPHERPDINGRPITPVFVTTTNVSETARWVAQRLNVELRDDEMDYDYPMIKCNINGQEKIYHLPFDQQYDRVKIDFALGERYAETVDEAERLGFRRAMRHRN